ncbi:MAG: hypothetical protein Q8O67_33540 [Deltaproteobacteria bacterium]|nr:hypothetical protein [Deltaproteobacteria bacterium]
MNDEGITGPSTSTMALSFAEVQERLPAGVTLERSLGASVLTVALRGFKPAAAFVVGGVGFAAYVAALAPEFGSVAPLGVLLLAAYGAFVFAFGKRRVTLEGGRLAVRTLPLPMIGDSTTDGTIDRVDVVIIGVRSGKLSYRVDVVIRGKRLPVIQDIKQEDTALVLARYLAGELKVELPINAVQLV